MQITELKKLERDLESLERARGMAEEVRAGLQDGKRETAAWLRMTLTGLIGAIDQRIGAKKKDIAWEAAEERIRKGAGKHDKGRLAEDGGKMTKRQMYTHLLLMVDALKRMESVNISGLTPKPGFEGSWNCWNQIADFLRTEMQEAEGAEKETNARKGS